MEYFSDLETAINKLEKGKTLIILLGIESKISAS